jgi:hypothetical protein
MPTAAGTTPFYAVADDGDGGRSATVSADVTVRNIAPTVVSFSASPAVVPAGGTVTLTVPSVTDGNGASDVRGVSFYRESNGVPGLQVGGDTGLGLDTTASDQYTLTIPASSLPGGTITYYAMAVDAAGAFSAAAGATNVVPAPPTIRALIDGPDPVRPGGTLTLTADGVSDPNGDAVTVWFYRESNGVAGLQADDALLGPAGAAGGYTLSVTAPNVAGGAQHFTYYAVGDDGTARGAVMSADSTVSDSSPLIHVQQVFVNGTGLTGGTTVNQVAFRAAAGVDNTYGYPVPAGATQLRSIPWYNGVNQIALRFDYPVFDLEQADLVIRDAAGATRADRAFAYDPATRTGVWTLQTPAVNDRLYLIFGAAGVSAFDGDWQNGSAGQAYPSGNGSIGGDFDFRVNVLGGDANGDGRVNALDIAFIKQRLARSATSPGAGSTAYSIFADLNADGQVNALDVAIAKQRLNRVLPTAIL